VPPRTRYFFSKLSIAIAVSSAQAPASGQAPKNAWFVDGTGSELQRPVHMMRLPA
jgi:hypothetical protein